jgi:hypothetical protein
MASAFAGTASPQFHQTGWAYTSGICYVTFSFKTMVFFLVDVYFYCHQLYKVDFSFLFPFS